jgi:hypothetical protein
MFRACLAQIVDVVGHIPQAKEPRLHVVLEDGHNNAEDAVRNYKWVQERVTQARRALAGLSLSNKKDCLPLAAADHFAYTAWGEKAGQTPANAAVSNRIIFVSFADFASPYLLVVALID